jgi:chemotaxis protein MotB
MRDLLRAIGAVLAEVPNRLTLEGHTDAAAFGWRRPRLQQLGAVGRPRQRLAPRADGRRPARGPVLRVQGLAASSLFDRRTRWPRPTAASASS